MFLPHVSMDWIGNGIFFVFNLDDRSSAFFFFKQHLHNIPLVTIMLFLFEMINVTWWSFVCVCLLLFFLSLLFLFPFDSCQTIPGPQQVNGQWSVMYRKWTLAEQRGLICLTRKPVKASNNTQLNHSRQWELLLIITALRCQEGR